MACVWLDCVSLSLSQPVPAFLSQQGVAHSSTDRVAVVTNSGAEVWPVLCSEWQHSNVMQRPVSSVKQVGSPSSVWKTLTLLLWLNVTSGKRWALVPHRHSSIEVIVSTSHQDSRLCDSCSADQINNVTQNLQSSVATVSKPSCEIWHKPSKGLIPHFSQTLFFVFTGSLLHWGKAYFQYRAVQYRRPWTATWLHPYTWCHLAPLPHTHTRTPSRLIYFIIITF